MKPNKKRLPMRLEVETVRKLTTNQLTHVVGGIVASLVAQTDFDECPSTRTGGSC
jgi:hypothetical protein